MSESILPKEDIDAEASQYANQGSIGRYVGDLGSLEEPEEYPYVIWTHFCHKFECLSTWGKTGIKPFYDFLNRLSLTTWNEIFKTAGGQKTGFGYTVFNINQIKNQRAKQQLQSVAQNISQDIQFFELRVTAKARVHGFKVKRAFYLVLVDKNHTLFK